VEELAHVLGREHVQLEFLLFKLLQLQHLLRSGDPRFLRWSAEEIKRASQRVHDIAVTRNERVVGVSRASGLAGDQITLAVLAERVPEPWSTIYAEHCLTFTRLSREVDAAVREARLLAEESGHAIADVLREIHHPVQAGLLPRQISLDNPMVLP
jgi:hypothetical protein